MNYIGNKTGGGGSVVTATPTSITIDGATTNLDTGLNQTAVDARVTALTQADALQTSAAKLKRVDTDAWEVPQTGVEYYAPPPYNLFGSKVRCQRFTGTGAGAEITLVASKVKRAIGAIGWTSDSATAYEGSYGSAHNSAYGSAVTWKSGGSLTLQRGSAVDDATDGWDLIAIYEIV